MRCPSTRAGLRPLPRSEGRGGFSLIELLTVIVVLGILATIAIPRFREAADRADAAVIVEDARTILQAGVVAFYENGQFPPDAAAGERPEALEPYLPGTDFIYEGTIPYTWRTGVDAAGDPTAYLYVDLSAHGGIAQAMERHEGPQSIWSPDEIVFWITP